MENLDVISVKKYIMSIWEYIGLATNLQKKVGGPSS